MRRQRQRRLRQRETANLIVPAKGSSAISSAFPRPAWARAPVRIEGTHKLFEAGGGSFGGNEEEESKGFSVQVGAGKSANINAPMLTNSGQFECSDTAQFDTFKAENKTAE